MPSKKTVHKVTVVAFDNISPFHLAVPCAVFGDALMKEQGFELQVCSASAAQLSTSAGFGLHLSHGLSSLARSSIVIVPSWSGTADQPSAALIKAIRAAHRRGALIVGLCLGAYVLAAAGLLDGRRASTHWACTQDFSTRYPNVQLDPDVLYVDEADVITSAGTAAGIDCCLHLVRRLCGAEIANRLARTLVVSPHRQGGQAQFIEHAVPVSSPDLRLSGLLDWLRNHLDKEHTLDSLAQRMHMTRRTFTRHFRQVTGSTVVQWLLGERIALTQRMLEQSSLDMEQISQRAGFGSVVSMRTHFRRVVGMPPKAWRDAFRAT